MNPIIQGVITGLIAALAASAILTAVSWSQGLWGKYQDVKYLRSLLSDGQKRVMEAEDSFHSGMNATMPADVLRAAQYNYMMKEVGLALERWTVHLSHDQRKEIYDALDWYNQSGLHAVRRNGQVQFVELRDGRWPTTTMTAEQAQIRFEKLRSIKWLKLP